VFDDREPIRSVASSCLLGGEEQHAGFGLPHTDTNPVSDADAHPDADRYTAADRIPHGHGKANGDAEPHAQADRYGHGHGCRI
jgi:hypothetical protein